MCFNPFFNNEDMQEITKHFVICHVDAPGQHVGASQFPQGYEALHVLKRQMSLLDWDMFIIEHFNYQVFMPVIKLSMIKFLKTPILYLFLI